MYQKINKKNTVFEKSYTHVKSKGISLVSLGLVVSSSSSVSLKCGMISLPTELTESESDLLDKSTGLLGCTGESSFSARSSLLLFIAVAAAKAAAEARNRSNKALCSANTSVLCCLSGVVEAGVAASLAAAKKWLEANKGLNKACLCKGKADRPGRLKVGGIKGKPGLLKGL